MNHQERIVQDYYELLVRNCEKCEIYIIRLKNDPRVYTGIPMIPLKFQDEETKRFALRILEPEDLEGLYERDIKEIESIERVNG